MNRANALLRLRRAMIGRVPLPGFTRRPMRDVLRRPGQVAIPSRFPMGGRIVRGGVKRRLALGTDPLLDARMGMKHWNRMLRRGRKQALY